MVSKCGIQQSCVPRGRKLEVVTHSAPHGETALASRSSLFWTGLISVPDAVFLILIVRTNFSIPGASLKSAYCPRRPEDLRPVMRLGVKVKGLRLQYSYALLLNMNKSSTVPFSRASICSFVKDVRFLCSFLFRRIRNWESSSPEELCSELPSEVQSLPSGDDMISLWTAEYWKNILNQNCILMKSSKNAQVASVMELEDPRTQDNHQILLQFHHINHFPLWRPHWVFKDQNTKLWLNFKTAALIQTFGSSRKDTRSDLQD